MIFGRPIFIAGERLACALSLSLPLSSLVVSLSRVTHIFSSRDFFSLSIRTVFFAYVSIYFYLQANSFFSLFAGIEDYASFNSKKISCFSLSISSILCNSLLCFQCKFIFSFSALRNFSFLFHWKNYVVVECVSVLLFRLFFAAGFIELLRDFLRFDFFYFFGSS